MSKKERNLAIGALLGAGIGYATGLLTAPRSGWRTRKKVVKSANKAKTDAEKQLKQLYTDLKTSLADGEKKLKSSKSKANKEFSTAVANTKVTKNKLKLLLTAIRNGDAEDPELKDMITEAKSAKANLAKFLKK